MFFGKQETRKPLTPYKAYEFKLGNSYLIKEVKPNIGYKLFIEHLNQGYKGLCITRVNPKFVNDKYGLNETPLLWLTEMDTDKSVEPTELEQLSYTMLKYINSNDQVVVLLDGLIYLINHNSYNTVLRFIQNMKDEVSSKKAVLIVSLNPNSLSQEELSILESELEILE